MPLRLARRWKVFLTAMGLCCVAASPVALLFPASRPLILLFLYTIPSHSVIPLPHEPAVVVAGKLYDPLLVALVAALVLLVCWAILARLRRHLEQLGGTGSGTVAGVATSWERWAGWTARSVRLGGATGCKIQSGKCKMKKNPYVVSIR